MEWLNFLLLPDQIGIKFHMLISLLSSLYTVPLSA